MSTNHEFDHTAVDELRLYVDNTRELYGQLESIQKNLINKMARGVYAPRLAPKAFSYLVDRASRMHNYEFGSPGGRVSRAVGQSLGYSGPHYFDKAVRDAVAVELARYFETEAALGNYDYMLAKKYQAKPTKKRATKKKATKRKSPVRKRSRSRS